MCTIEARKGKAVFMKTVYFLEKWQFAYPIKPEKRTLKIKGGSLLAIIYIISYRVWGACGEYKINCVELRPAKQVRRAYK